MKTATQILDSMQRFCEYRDPSDGYFRVRTRTAFGLAVTALAWEYLRIALVVRS